MSDKPRPRVKVLKDGPYLVTGAVPLLKTTIGIDDAGDSVEWIEGEQIPAGEQCTLCRCGRSARKPFCDGSHTEVAFDGTEVAERGDYMDRATVLDGPGVRVTDVVELCAEARYCAAKGGLWNMVSDTDDADVAERVISQSTLCPSGRYIAWDAPTGVAYELDLLWRTRRSGSAAGCGSAAASRWSLPTASPTRSATARRCAGVAVRPTSRSVTGTIARRGSLTVSDASRPGAPSRVR
jgi:CDGSH-type Zn-finger protein